MKLYFCHCNPHRVKHYVTNEILASCILFFRLSLEGLSCHQIWKLYFAHFCTSLFIHCSESAYIFMYLSTVTFSAHLFMLKSTVAGYSSSSSSGPESGTLLWPHTHGTGCVSQNRHWSCSAASSGRMLTVQLVAHNSSLLVGETLRSEQTVQERRSSVTLYQSLMLVNTLSRMSNPLAISENICSTASI